MALTNVVYIEICANGAAYQAYRPAWDALELKTLPLLPATYWIGSAAKMNRAKAMLQSLAKRLAVFTRSVPQPNQRTLFTELRCAKLPQRPGKKTKPLLQEVNAKHGQDRKRRGASPVETSLAEKLAIGEASI